MSNRRLATGKTFEVKHIQGFSHPNSFLRSCFTIHRIPRVCMYLLIHTSTDRVLAHVRATCHLSLQNSHYWITMMNFKTVTFSSSKNSRAASQYAFIWTHNPIRQGKTLDKSAHMVENLRKMPSRVGTVPELVALDSDLMCQESDGEWERERYHNHDKKLQFKNSHHLRIPA